MKRALSALGDSHMGRLVRPQASGRLVGLIPRGDRVQLVIDYPASSEVEIVKEPS